MNKIETNRSRFYLSIILEFWFSIRVYLRLSAVALPL